MLKCIIGFISFVLVVPAQAISLRDRKEIVCYTLLRNIDVQNLATITKLKEDMGWPELTYKQGLFLLKYWSERYGIYSVSMSEGELQVGALRGPLAEFLKSVIREENLQDITITELSGMPIVQAETGSTWQPSAHVKQLFAEYTDIEPYLNLKPTDIIYVDIYFLPDAQRQLEARNSVAQMPMSKWWQEWIKKEFAGDSLAWLYIKTIRYLDYLYGSKLLVLMSRDLEIIKPKSGNITHGSFGVRGPLKVIAEVLDYLPDVIVVSPQALAPQDAFGVRRPLPVQR